MSMIRSPMQLIPDDAFSGMYMATVNGSPDGVDQGVPNALAQDAERRGEDREHVNHMLDQSFDMKNGILALLGDWASKHPGSPIAQLYESLQGAMSGDFRHILGEGLSMARDRDYQPGVTAEPSATPAATQQMTLST